jgi:hypothetical protein
VGVPCVRLYGCSSTKSSCAQWLANVDIPHSTLPWEWGSDYSCLSPTDVWRDCIILRDRNVWSDSVILRDGNVWPGRIIQRERNVWPDSIILRDDSVFPDKIQFWEVETCDWTSKMEELVGIISFLLQLQKILASRLVDPPLPAAVLWTRIILLCVRT